MLAVKKNRLKDLIKFGFKTDDFENYVYKGKVLGWEYSVHVTSWMPVLSISEYDTEYFEFDTVVSVPDVIIDLIEAGMVERDD